MSSNSIGHTRPCNANVTRVRSRTGCQNCRRRRKKCDELRPVCRACIRNGDDCQWGLKLVFRPEHAETIAADHPSMQQRTPLPRHPRDFDIIDVTAEVIRDYLNDDTDTLDGAGLANPVAPKDLSPETTHAAADDSAQEITHLTVEDSIVNEQDSPTRSSLLPKDPHYEVLQSIAAGLLDLGRPDCVPSITGACQEYPSGSESHTTRQTYEDALQDGLFVPGSAYFESHSALRNHTFRAARSVAPTRQATPRPCTSEGVDRVSGITPLHPSPELSHLAEFRGITPHEEYELWKNWIDEIAPWLDKFDSRSHFGHVLPTLAREHPHLRFSALALSSRQLERKYTDRSYNSLDFYQEAIRQLIPQLQTRTTTIVASCVVLCVLEMMNCKCSPNMWRQHLDGCACLIQSLNINGSSGGFEQALFWCFARMDLCGALISNESTIIPKENWLSSSISQMSISALSQSFGFDMYANYVVYLCAQVMDLSGNGMEERDYADKWQAIFAQLAAWYNHRSPEMRPVLDIPSTDADFTRPFPTLLFSNPSAISGTQLYHTACLLMLQKKPQRVMLGSSTRSTLWHARRICAISISNTHHGCWTNSIQPLWIAGRYMSHHAEHRAILETYKLIEKETGWGAKWRADDLQAFWGDLEGD
ncbi:hypothetical protein M426DRAFT_56747 [Hypoxylon sp. CI-4A]|nr:hypothetical protein M426DRAFT_56747 [Hypoxylon sp. CI-4A]